MKELYRQFIGVAGFKESGVQGPIYYPPFRARVRIRQTDESTIDASTESIIRLTTFNIYTDPLNRIPEVWDVVLDQHGKWKSNFLISLEWNHNWLTDENGQPYDPTQDEFTTSEIESNFPDGDWGNIGLVEPNYDLEGLLQFVKLVRK